MKRKFKTVGIVMASVFAMSAIVASTASATPRTQFHASSVPAAITGSKTVNHIFTTNQGTVSCNVATFSGTQTVKTSATTTLKPHYTGCKAFGFIDVPIHVNGCAYVFDAKGTTTVECPTGKEIEITAPGCTTKVGPQHFATGMTYTVAGSSPNRHITAHTNISGIKYNQCGTPASNGTYTGSTTVDVAAGEIWAS